MNEATPKILEVGDVVFTNSRINGVRKFEITRVTPKKAYIDGKLVDNTTPRNNWYIGGSGFWATTYYLSTPELNEKYKKSQLVRFLSSVRTDQYEQMTTEQLESIYKIIKETTK